MHNQTYVVSLLLDLLYRNNFNYLARKYGGNKYVKQLTCYYQLYVLMFGQLSNRERLLYVVLATKAYASKAYHLGFRKHAAKIILVDANTKRNYRIFGEFAYKVIAEVQRCEIVDILKRLHNIGCIGSDFVIREKTNNDFKPMKWKRRFPLESGILSDTVDYIAG